MALNGRFNRRRDARPDGEAQPLGARAANALGWNVFNALATRLGTMAIGIALARILGPEEFGTFAVATVMLLAVLSFNELGVSLAIVRWSGSPHEIAPTVATLATAASAVLALAAFVAAPAFCAAMGAPAATDVVRVLALTIVISGIVAGPAALLQRDFRARTRALIDQAGTWTGSSVAIGTAIGGMGAMSLATGRLAATSVTLVLFLRAAPIRFGFDRSVARRLLSFGLPLAGSSIVFFAAAYADQLIVGAVLGPVALGFYVLAFNLSSWPQTVFSLPVRNVSPAAFARLRDRPAILNDSFVRSVGLLTAIAFPICLALSGAAVPLIDVVYGDVWRTAAGALIWLGIVAALRILFEIAYDFLVVLGKTRQVFAIQIGSLAGSVPAVYAGAEIAGIAGAGAALIAVGMCITLPGYLFYLKRSGVSISQLGSTLVAPVIAAVAVAGAAFAADYLIAFDLLAVGVTGLAGLAMFALRYRSIRTQIKELGDRMSTEEEAGTAAAAPPRMPVSIVCVANDPAVREHCLDRSIAALRHEAPETEYVPIDNTGSKYDSAGAALNEGARRARHDYVVFVHQDVFLHSLRALEESAGALANDPSIGILGAYGSTETGHAVGQIRDRVLLLGEPPSEPSDVESLDEVLFMIPRERVLREPLSEDAELAWHAYAVDYGLRMRAQGMKVLATNIPLTHNSLTVNLARLDVAHRAVAKRHPWALPVHTTCGTITATTEGARKLPSPLGRHRWRYRWLKESLMAHRARRAVGGAVVLSDVRHDVDDLLEAHSGMLRIINLELAPGPERNPHADQIKLQRLGRQITVESMTFPELTEAAANWRDGGSMLMTNLSLADLRALAGRLPAGCRRLVGCHDGHGFWLLLCRGDAAAAAIWETRRATPLGMEPVTVAAVALTDSPRPDGARA